MDHDKPKAGARNRVHGHGRGDRRSGKDTRSKSDKFLYGNSRFRFRIYNPIPDDAGMVIVEDRKIRKNTADKPPHDRRAKRDRRSGLDTRSEEEKFLQGERRSGIDRRTVMEGRYRSFKKARAFVRGLGLKSADQWRAYNRSGKKPNDIPVAPHHIYANDGWAGWSDFLGASPAAMYLAKYRSFKKARAFVRRLGLKSGTEWRTYCKSGKKPADIPAKPDDSYAGDGWAGMGDWLGAR
jgi:hypothetical protein